MRESQLKLRDKTIMLVGPFSQITQTLTTTLTELGSDVAIVTEKASYNGAMKFAENVTNGREINSEFGRAAALGNDVKSEAQVKDCVSRVAELFGGIDVVVDASLSDCSLWFDENGDRKQATDELEELNQSVILIQGALPFLTGRKKGRIISMTQGNPCAQESSNCRQTSLLKKTRELVASVGRDIATSGVTINALELGTTEEFLLARYPNQPSIKEALSELNTDCVRELIEARDVANVVAFLASPMSSAINGQVIVLDKGLN